MRREGNGGVVQAREEMGVDGRGRVIEVEEEGGAADIGREGSEGGHLSVVKEEKRVRTRQRSGDSEDAPV